MQIKMFLYIFTVISIASASSIQLPDLTLQSVAFIGNASFGRATGQIELNNPIPATSDSTDSAGRALYNMPVRLLNPPTSFDTSFTFSTLAGSSLDFVIVPNNQDLTTQYGFSLKFATGNNTVSVLSGARVLATTVSDFDLGLDFSRNFAWVSYDSDSGKLDVRTNNLSIVPDFPILELDLDLSTILNQFMFVGFSASASLSSAKSTIYAWNFTSWIPSPAVDPVPVTSTHSTSSSRARNLTIAVIVSTVLFVSVATGLIIVTRNMKQKRNPWSVNTTKAVLSDAREQPSVLRRFTLKELVSATANFEPKRKLGPVPSMSRCFRGELLDSIVAVKVVTSEEASGIVGDTTVSKVVQEFASVRHRNLVGIIGWCENPDNTMLVYEFVANDSLDKHLFGKTLLAWSHRHKVVCGVAEGLRHLHTKGLLHGNIKASNILLDSSFTPKLGDYALKHRSIVAGTFGYVAPESIQTGKISTCADVFAYGAVVLELVCGRRALEIEDEERGIFSVLVERVWEVMRNGGKLEDVVDKKLGGLYDVAEMEAMVSVGLACSDMDPDRRPSMEDVVKILAGEMPLPRLSFDDKEAKKDDEQRPIDELLSVKDFRSLLV